jgi:NADH-quinone oxidoreductase subunit C
MSELLDRLRARFADAIIEEVETASPYILVKTEAIREVALHCRELGFDSLMCLSAVDTKGMKADTQPLPAGSPKTAKSAPPPEQFWVVYHLGSTTTREKAALKVIADRTQPRVPSVSSVWGVANWHEREAFDMFGIIFEGHPNLTRILCCEDWVGWPLRKDYVFPTRYHDVPHDRMPSGGESAEHPAASAGAASGGGKEAGGGH